MPVPAHICSTAGEIELERPRSWNQDLLRSTVTAGRGGKCYLKYQPNPNMACWELASIFLLGNTATVRKGEICREIPAKTKKKPGAKSGQGRSTCASC